MTNRNNDNFFGGSSGFIILILFLLGMCNGFGFGGGYNGNANSIKSDLYEGLNSQNTFSEFRSMQNEITNGFANVNQNLCAGFGGVQNSLSLGFGGIQSAIADSNYRMADCCCQIKNIVHEENEKTRGLIQQNEIQKLRDELQDVKNEQLATGLTTAQIIQTNNLENFIRQIVTPATAPTA